MAKKRGIGVIVMKPIAGGAIENGALSLKFILRNDNVCVAIPGMDSTEQVVRNAAVIKESTVFTGDELQEMDDIAMTLGESFCRRCGYCLPCPQGIDIPTQFILEGYMTRYNLSDWAIERYKGQAIDASSCIACGICESKCPYHLSIREMLSNVVTVFK